MKEKQRPRQNNSSFISRKELRLIAILAVLAVVLSGCGSSSRGSGSKKSSSEKSSDPKTVAENYVSQIIDGDVEGRRKLLAYDYKEYMIDKYGNGDEKDFCEYMSDKYDEDIESWKDYCKVIAANNKVDKKDYYGKYKIEIEATKVKELSAKKLKEAVGGDAFYKQYASYGLDPDRISEGEEITVKAKISGEDASDKIIFTVYLAKIGSSWKVLNVYSVSD